jgi:hypothetical protein
LNRRLEEHLAHGGVEVHPAAVNDALPRLPGDLTDGDRLATSAGAGVDERGHIEPGFQVGGEDRQSGSVGSIASVGRESGPKWRRETNESATSLEANTSAYG